MPLTTLQWNVGGCRFRTAQHDPRNPASYQHEDSARVAEQIRACGADVVTLQELHVDDQRSQGAEIAAALGWPPPQVDAYDQSHLDPTQRLSQAVLSRSPMHRVSFTFFPNLHLTMTAPDGQRWETHDKGASRVVVELPDGPLEVQTCHALPAQKFGVPRTDRRAIDLYVAMSTTMHPDAARSLIALDANVDDASLREVFPLLFDAGMQEVLQESPTTPKGRRYDHVLFRGIELLESRVLDDALTDHYPLVTRFAVG